MKGDVISCHNGSTWLYSGILCGGIGILADNFVRSESKRWLGKIRYYLTCKFQWRLFLRFASDFSPATQVMYMIEKALNVCFYSYTNSTTV